MNVETEKERLKRLKIAIKKKKIDFEIEHQKLLSLKKEHENLKKEMLDRQQRYLNATEKLNQARLNNEKLILITFDSGIDKLRNEWAEFFRGTKVYEKQILIQNEKVFESKKSVDKLEEMISNLDKSIKQFQVNLSLEINLENHKRYNKERVFI